MWRTWSCCLLKVIAQNLQVTLVSVSSCISHRCLGIFVLSIALSQWGHLSFADCIMCNNVCTRRGKVSVWLVSGVSCFFKGCLLGKSILGMLFDNWWIAV